MVSKLVFQISDNMLSIHARSSTAVCRPFPSTPPLLPWVSRRAAVACCAAKQAGFFSPFSLTIPLFPATQKMEEPFQMNSLEWMSPLIFKWEVLAFNGWRFRYFSFSKFRGLLHMNLFLFFSLWRPYFFHKVSINSAFIWAANEVVQKIMYMYHEPIC